MRIFCALVLSFLAGCSSCDRGSSSADADARRDAGPEDAGFDAAGPLGANEGFIKRYEDEEAREHVTRTVVATKALVFTAHPTGDAVATLAEGKSVDVVAEHAGYYLASFDSDGRKLLGWVVKLAFEQLEAGAEAGTRITTLRCTGQKILVLQDGRTKCDYVCYRDLECQDGSKCEAAIELPKNGVIEAEPRFTSVCSGTPVAQRKDGGMPSLFGEMRQPDGTCRKGTAEAKKLGPLCFQSCTTDRDCPPDSACKVVDGATEKLCNAN